MNKQVLVVDDDDSVLNTVSRILLSAGLQVQKASSGGGCLEILEGGFSGLVLMDVVMPKMDGWDTIQAIVDGGHAERVIICMLTGVDDPGVKMEGLKEYVLDYIRKPFDPEKLIKIVKDYLTYLH